MFSALFIACNTVEASPCAPQQISESAKVRYVNDGDTVHFEDGRKIRLIGIDSEVNSGSLLEGKQDVRLVSILLVLANSVPPRLAGEWIL